MNRNQVDSVPMMIMPSLSPDDWTRVGCGFWLGFSLHARLSFPSSARCLCCWWFVVFALSQKNLFIWGVGNIIWKFLKLITCSVSLLNLARIMFYYRSNARWMMQKKQLTTAQQRWAWSEMREIKKNKSMMMMKSVKRKESGQQTPIYWSLPSIGLHIIHCMLTLLPFPYVRAVMMLSSQARAQTIKSWSAILISSKSTCSQLCVYTI